MTEDTSGYEQTFLFIYLSQHNFWDLKCSKMGCICHQFNVSEAAIRGNHQNYLIQCTQFEPFFRLKCCQFCWQHLSVINRLKYICTSPKVQKKNCCWKWCPIFRGVWIIWTTMLVAGSTNSSPSSTLSTFLQHVHI